MKKLVCAAILIVFVLLTTEAGCDGTSPVPPEEKFEPFSFAVINDVHVGRDIHDSGEEDYGAMGWADYNLKTGRAIDNNEGGFNYITDLLNRLN